MMAVGFSSRASMGEHENLRGGMAPYMDESLIQKDVKSSAFHA